MRHNTERESGEYIKLTYIPQEQYKPARITNVYYGSVREGNWTYLGCIEEKGNHAAPTFSLFDRSNRKVIAKASDWESVHRYYQNAGYALIGKVKEQEMQLKSFRRKKDRKRKKEIER